MSKSTKVFPILTILILWMSGSFGQAEEFEQRTDFPPIGRTDPAAYIKVENYHGGAGSIRYIELLGREDFETNILFLRSSVIPPKCGIGEHTHEKTEVMYINLDGPVFFTLDGHTSVLPPGSMVLCPMGSSHGIYNHSNREIRLLSIAVALERGKYDAVDCNNDLTGERPETPPQFIWALLDRSLLNAGKNAHQGKGPIFSRRIWLNDSFKTNWFVVTHAILPPGSSIGYHQHNTREEVYHVISGKGRMTVNGHSFDVRDGDAALCNLRGSHGIYNNSNEDLELLVFSAAIEKGYVKFEKNWGDDLTDR